MISFLMLFTFDSIAQSKAGKPYSISPIPLDFDSILSVNILQEENVKRISNSLILISRESMVDNDGAELYYKKDSMFWFGIHIDYEHIKVDTVNLDNKGKPELILNCYAYSYGSGGGSGTGAFIVINIDSFPMELMNVKKYCFEEAFGRTYGDDTIPTTAYATRYTRKIVCQDTSIVVDTNNLSDLKSLIQTTGGECELTQIPSGIYRMIEGRLTLQKK